MIFPNEIQALFNVLVKAGKKQSTDIYLCGEALFAPLYGNPIPSTLTFFIDKEDFDRHVFWQDITADVVIAEIESTTRKWIVSSDHNILDFSLQRMPTGVLSCDNIVYNLSSPGADPVFDELSLLRDRDGWGILDILLFSKAMSNYEGVRLASDFSGLSLYALPEYDQTTTLLMNIVVSVSPDVAFRFIRDFVDGRKWLTNELLKMAQLLNIPIDENIMTEDVVGDHKLELLGVYADFFKSDSESRTITKVDSMLTTYLRLVFNSPEFSTTLPYIKNTVYVSSSGLMAGNSSQLRAASFPDPPYPPVACDPTECGELHPGSPCCCCVPQSIVSQVAVRCHEKVMVSCNKDGTGPGPGLEPEFPAACDLCRDVCGRILSGSLACADLPNEDWWHYDPTWHDTCHCDCMVHQGPGENEGPCLLTCAKCGTLCSSEFEITPASAGDCQFSATSKPSAACCGTPSIIDMMFVVDNSLSMGNNIDHIREEIDILVERASDQGAELRVGLTTFGHFADDQAIVLQLTTDIYAFKLALFNIELLGGYEYDLRAVTYAVLNTQWLATDRYILLFADEHSQPDNTAQQDLIDAIATCKENRVIVFAIEEASTKRVQLAAETGGQRYDINLPFSQVFAELQITTFPSACECLNNQWVSILYSASGNVEQQCLDPETNLPIIDPATGLPPERCTSIPIHVCNIGDDCTETCTLPYSLWACGTTITVNPLEVSLLCCSDVGYGCSCQQSPERGYCCGPTDECDPVCDHTSGFPLYNDLQDAQEATWCKCFDKASEKIPDTCHHCCCPDRNLPIGHRWYPCYLLDAILPGDPLYTQAQELLANQQCCNTPEPESDDCCHLCLLVPDASGSTTRYCKEQMDADVAAAFKSCRERNVPDFECNQEELNGVDCITAKIDSEAPCLEPRAGGGSVSHPSTTVLNNGIGLVAYEVHEGEQPYSTIRVEQLKTSVVAKFLPNRVFNFGRLQHSSKWEPQSNGYSKVKLYYYDDIPSYLVSVASDRITYVLDYLTPQSLYSLDDSSDLTASFIGYTPEQISALAVSSTQVLYAISYTLRMPYRVYQVGFDPLSFTDLGVLTGIDSPTNLFDVVFGLVFDRDDSNKVWYSRGQRIGYFYLDTLVATEVFASPSYLRGLAIDDQDRMFVGVLYSTSSRLAEYDRTTNVLTTKDVLNQETNLVSLYCVDDILYEVWSNKIGVVDKSSGAISSTETIDLAPNIHGATSYINTDSESAQNDTISFRTGPLRGKCFPLAMNPDDSILGVDSVGRFVPFLVPPGAITEAYTSGDDVYNVEWLLMNKADQGLVGNSIDTVTTGKDFDIDDSSVISKALKELTHKHNGSPVPVAYPSITCARNYMNADENSHYVYVAYQAMEDEKWNIYLREIRLSEYDKEKQIDDVVSTDLLDIRGTYSEVLYRIVGIDDIVTHVGDDAVASRTIVVEVLLSDGREILNKHTTGSWGQLCGDYPSESFPKRKVFGRITHAAVMYGTPNIFDLDEVFYTWSVGEEYACSIDVITANQVFNCLRKSGESSVPTGVYDVPIEVGNVYVKSSYVTVTWYQDILIDGWYAMINVPLTTLQTYKGFDISEPILISDNVEHSMKPVVEVNYNNDIFIAYEKTVTGVPQIAIAATATPASSLPGGVIKQKNPDDTLNYFLSPADFVFKETITSEGVNQSPSIYIDRNDNVHLVWQSNKDRRWETYYANADNGFTLERITNSDGNSLKPRVTGDNEGNLYVVWHDNRFGNYEIMLSYKLQQRVLPYSQQDPYWAGVRNLYTHVENDVPLELTNSSGLGQCFSDITVSFYYDRNLSRKAFDIGYSEYPFAFSFSGLESSSHTQEFSNFSVWESSANEYLTYITSPEFDTGLFSGSPYKVKVTGVCSVLISVRSSDVAGDSAAESQWSEWATIEPNVWNIYSDLDLASSSGQYKQVQIAYDLDCAAPTLFQLISNSSSRICIRDDETLIGTLFLTPEIKVNSYSTDVVAIPLAMLFAQNNTYFISVSGTGDDGTTYYFNDQRTTVSCYSCVRTVRHFYSTSCTHLIQYSNDTALSQVVDFSVVFYVDKACAVEAMTFDTGAATIVHFSKEDGTTVETGGTTIYPGQTVSLLLTPPISSVAGTKAALNCGVVYGVKTFASIDGSLTQNEELSQSVWSCDCGSPRFSSRPIQSIDTLARWHSSGFGYSDTRLTETRSNNYNPALKIKSNYHGVVLYETDRILHTDNVEQEYHEIFSSVFKLIPDETAFATGSQAIVTPSTGTIARSDIRMSVPLKQAFIAGNNVDFSLDQYDNMFIAVEEPGSPLLGTTAPDGLEDMGAFKRQRFIKVYRLDHEDLDFTTGFATVTGSGGSTAEEVVDPDKCVERITCYYYEEDSTNEIVKKINVKDDSIRYHITRLNRQVPVVKSCNLTFIVVGTPETVAVRLRSSVEQAWSDWFAFDSEIGEHTVEISWSLTKGNGIKNVYFQFATYQGLTSSVIFELIADYDQTPYSIYLYKAVEGKTPPDAYTDDSVFNEDNKSRLFGATPVAGLQSAGVDGIQVDSSYVFIEIIPETEVTEPVKFDFIQQGIDDYLDQPTYKVLNSNKYRGSIRITKEDLTHKDGYAAIVPHFQEDCYIGPSTGVSLGQQIGFNPPVETPVTFSSSPDQPVVPLDDPWLSERDEHGLINYKVVIRPEDDPHFVFGDPNYRLEKQDG